MQAVLINIGSEITTGDIVNSNSQRLSRGLYDMGIHAAWHLTVADKTEDILDALDVAARKSKLIFTTGGLGPTSDDFTRDVIAKWCEDELEFSEESWQKIVNWLEKAGVSVSDTNRQQCFFPSRAKILQNNAGTADAFIAEKGSHRIVVLPGPPFEISAVWEDHLATWLRDSYPGLAATEIRRWHCLGQSESVLAEYIDPLVQDQGLTIGYRPHFPYVEVKVWMPKDLSPEQERAIASIAQVIKPWVVIEGESDLADVILSKLRPYEQFNIVDQVTCGALAERLNARLRNPEWSDLRTRVSTVSSGPSQEADLVLRPDGNQSWTVQLGNTGTQLAVKRNYPERLKSRLFGVQAEMTLAWLHTELK